MATHKKTTYVFIPGKNGKLSLAELVSFLQARNYAFEVSDVTKVFFTVNISESFSPSAIADLGGIIKIGKVATEVPTQTVEDAFLQRNKQSQKQVRMSLSSSGIGEEMLISSLHKSVFGVSVYNAERHLFPVSKTMQRFLGNTVKHDLATNGKKSGFMGFSRGRREPQLTHVEVLKKNLVEKKAEILFCVGRRRASLSTTVAVHNPFEFQKRDVGRPIQRKIFAIPPRLARIMINQTFFTPGKSLLDPFCGVGTILQEALLAGAKVIGVDLNPWCVNATRENLEWLKKEYRLETSEYAILQGDSRRLTESIHQEIDCIATEPDLGPALRHIPTIAYATKIIENHKSLYYGFLEEAYRILKKGGRLALVTPYIKTRSSEPVTMRIDDRAVSVGFRRVYPFQPEFFGPDVVPSENLMETNSFVDIGKKHKIGREIHVFQK
jgi:tRNA G10  N-methylase Trm11